LYNKANNILTHASENEQFYLLSALLIYFNDSQLFFKKNEVLKDSIYFNQKKNPYNYLKY